MKQRCRQEREEMEDWHHQEYEEAKLHLRRDFKEAEERHKHRLDRQLQNQTEMMQMFMMSIMDGHTKRNRDNEDNKEDEE